MTSIPAQPTCSTCGQAKPLAEFDQRFIGKGTRINCAVCRRQAAEERWLAKLEAEIEQRQAELMGFASVAEMMAAQLQEWEREDEQRALEREAEERAAWEAHVSKCRRIEDVRGTPTRDKSAATEPAIFIYALADPRSGAICYVGITQRPAHRYRDHLAGDPKNPAKYDWVRELAAAGQQPEMHLLEVISTGEYGAQWQERRWINTFEHVGIRLLNLDHGDVFGSMKPLPTE